MSAARDEALLKAFVEWYWLGRPDYQQRVRPAPGSIAAFLAAREPPCPSSCTANCEHHPVSQEPPVADPAAEWQRLTTGSMVAACNALAADAKPDAIPIPTATPTDITKPEPGRGG